MERLTYKNVDLKLVEAIPELKAEYDKEMQSWEGAHPGQHNVFGNIFNPFLTTLLETGKSEILLRRMFDFLEEMANSADEDVVNVVAVTICERLGDDPNWLSRARQLMGPKTKEISIRVEKWWGRE